MPYIGNASANRFVASKAATQFSGDGSTTAFTLDHSVGADEDILVSVDGVVQEPSVAYAVSGTTLTFTAAPSTNSGNNIFVYYLFRTVGTIDHPATSALSATSGTFSTDLTVDTSTLKVDSTNNRVGVGTASPDATAHVFTGSSGVTNPHTYTKLHLETADHSAMQFSGSSSGEQWIWFADDTTATPVGGITYYHGGPYMAFRTEGSERMRIDGNGHVTMPSQPAFSAHKDGTDQSNFAIGGETIVWSAERFDQNSDFDLTNNRFTAPVTGKYFLQVQIRFENLDTAATYYILSISTSNQTYYFILDPDYFDQDAVYYSMAFSVLADMDANDTSTVIINQNAGTAQTDIDGNAQYTFFTGHLVC